MEDLLQTTKSWPHLLLSNARAGNMQSGHCRLFRKTLDCCRSLHNIRLASIVRYALGCDEPARVERRIPAATFDRLVASAGIAPMSADLRIVAVGNRPGSARSRRLRSLQAALAERYVVPTEAVTLPSLVRGANEIRTTDNAFEEAARIAPEDLNDHSRGFSGQLSAIQHHPGPTLSASGYKLNQGC